MLQNNKMQQSCRRAVHTLETQHRQLADLGRSPINCMTVPEHLWRFPTAAAIAAMASRFNVPHDPDMQDWEWKVADSTRLDEYLAAYRCGSLTDDDRFTLMETIIQAFEDHPDPLHANSLWHKTLLLLDTGIDLHAYSVWYWSDLEDELGDESWRVTPYLRKLVARHKSRLDPA